MCRHCLSLDKATFEPYVTRDSDGRVRFENRWHAQGSFRERCWPVLQPVRRTFRDRERRRFFPSALGEKASRSITRASRVAAALRWLPCNPLFAHVMRVEDARYSARKGGTAP